MVKRSGNLKINFTEIARELGGSVMTLYPVVNQSPLVSRKTRGRVIEALNRHRYFTRKRIKQVRILFDFITGNRYLRDLGGTADKKIAAERIFLPFLQLPGTSAGISECRCRYLFNEAFTDRCFELLGSRIKSCHVKDTIMASNLTCSLTETPCGSVGYNLRHYLEQINGCDPEMPVIIEHLGS